MEIVNEKINFVDSEKDVVSLSKSIENFIESKEFYSLLQKLKVLFEESALHSNINILNYMFGTIIDYYVMFFNENKNIDRELYEVLAEEINFILNLELNEEYSMFGFSRDEKDKLECFISKLFLQQIQNKNMNVKEVLSNKFIFHSFNFAFLEGIKADGINSKSKQKQVFSKSMRELEKIFYKYNLSPTAYGDFDEFAVYYSETPFVSYEYTQTSPEWFYLFSGAGNVYSSIEKDLNDEFAFALKDYNSAKSNITKLMDENEFTEKDKNKFFMVYNNLWEIFNKEYNMLVIKPIKKAEKILDITDDKLKEMENYLFSFNDQKSYKKISVKDAIYVKLPNISTIYEKIGINKRKNIIK